MSTPLQPKLRRLARDLGGVDRLLKHRRRQEGELEPVRSVLPVKASLFSRTAMYAKYWYNLN